MEHTDSLGRRRFLRQAAVAAATIPSLTILTRLGAWAASPQEDDASKASAGAPANLSWQTVIISPGEPGEPLVVSGVIYAPDGKTPAEGARLYVYQTGANGLYVPRMSIRRTPRIRGWMKTGTDGRYEFRTVRPGSYPGSRIPAHIHATLAAANDPDHWIDDFHFEDDPFISDEDRAKPGRDGEFSSVLRTVRDPNGTLRATRHIKLRQGQR